MQVLMGTLELTGTSDYLENGRATSPNLGVQLCKTDCGKSGRRPPYKRHMSPNFSKAALLTGTSVDISEACAHSGRAPHAGGRSPIATKMAVSRGIRAQPLVVS